MADALHALATGGHFVIPAEQLAWHADTGAWELATRIVGGPPRMVERQRIRAVPDGKSFASTDRETPLHNDLQLYMGSPADLQILACVRPAEHGGESLLLDGWALLRTIEARDPALFGALFDTVRRFPFIAGTVRSATVASFGDRLALLHAPKLAPGDLLGERVRAAVADQPLARVKICAGEILVVDNHRTLHGRTAFSGGDRELVRLLVWLRDRAALPAIPAEWLARAHRSPARPALPPAAPGGEQRLDLVMRMLTGTSPGSLAREAGGGEAELYRMRDRALRAALEALATRDDASGD